MPIRGGHQNQSIPLAHNGYSWNHSDSAEHGPIIETILPLDGPGGGIEGTQTPLTTLSSDGRLTTRHVEIFSVPGAR